MGCTHTQIRIKDVNLLNISCLNENQPVTEWAVSCLLFADFRGLTQNSGHFPLF
nr:MAG TPA: hypothetical protein [Caudoviricetes sp.]